MPIPRAKNPPQGRPPEPAWLKSRRFLAERLVQELPAPSFKYGLGVSFDQAGVRLPLDIAPDGRKQPPATVIGDGSPVLSWEQALRRSMLAAKMREYLSAVPAPGDRLWAWHEANCSGGLVIHLPAGYRAAGPIRLEYRQGRGSRLDRLLIVAEPGSAATVVEHLSSEPGKAGTAAFRGAAVDILAEDGAEINFISIQNLDERSVAFARKRARCGRRAGVSWIEGAFGGDLISDDVSTELRGAGSRTAMRSLFFGSGRQRYDLLQAARHLAPETVSDMASRGALTERAQAVCRGLIRIERGSRGCQGRQKADTLLLQESARVATMPSLEIHEADVSCGHASATGRLDPEQLFYLMSRGLDEAAATRQLVDGFFAPLVREMRVYGLEDMVSCLVGHRLGSPSGSLLSANICVKK